LTLRVFFDDILLCVVLVAFPHRPSLIPINIL
jgi:hypothetical protein